MKKTTEDVKMEAANALRKQFEEDLELMKIRHKITIEELHIAQELIRDKFIADFEEKISKL